MVTSTRIDSGLIVKLHNDEVDIDINAVWRMISAQSPQWANLDLKPMDSTCTDNVMLRLDTDLVFRLPRCKYAIDNLLSRHTLHAQEAPRCDTD